MTDDRFGDLGAERRSAAERFAELDEREPEPQPEAPGPPRPSGRYSWVVGIAFLILIIVVAVNTLPDAGEGVFGPEKGSRLPVFAAPNALSGDDQVANVKQSAADDDAGNDTPACAVTGEDIVNVCEVRGEQPVVLSFVAAGSDCEDQFDTIAVAGTRYRDTAFIGVLIGTEQPRARDLVRERGWGFPIAVDRDLAVFNLYRLAVCSTVFARRDGRVVSTRLGELSETEFASELRRIGAR
jgi:hypothetical protein